LDNEYGSRSGEVEPIITEIIEQLRLFVAA
jgi:hypothetical protein